jgi:NAD(P)-dependent dehydrogenase (short-subunit alcohol dehydrogenase family)
VAPLSRGRELPDSAVRYALAGAALGPAQPAHTISKAAAFNLTQSLRALLAGRGVRVHAVLTGSTDTDMTRGFDMG